jgi:hypothetical protein
MQRLGDNVEQGWPQDFVGVLMLLDEVSVTSCIPTKFAPGETQNRATSIISKYITDQICSMLTNECYTQHKFMPGIC